MDKKFNNITVQGTNDSSSVSKASMVSKGYFHDEFIGCFVKKRSSYHKKNTVVDLDRNNSNDFTRRSPIINRGYYIRSYSIHKLLETFFNNFLHTSVQVLSIGSGFDSSFWRLENCMKDDDVYIEVDFSELQMRKFDLIRQNPKLFDTIVKTESDKELLVKAGLNKTKDDRIILNTKKYKMVGCNIIDTKRLTELLKEILDYKYEAGCVKFTKPTLILSEVVLAYLEADDSCRFIQWAAEAFTDSVFVTYEQMNPTDEFGVFMCKHFLKLQSPLRTIYQYPTLTSQCQRYLSLGYQSCKAISMLLYYMCCIDEQEKARVDELELFDEFEEFYMKCHHYFLMTAFNGVCKALMHHVFTLNNSIKCNVSMKNYLIEANKQEMDKLEDSKSNEEIMYSSVDELDVMCPRYGHSTCCLAFGGGDDGACHFVIGGFLAEENSSHCRSKSLQVFNLNLANGVGDLRKDDKNYDICKDEPPVDNGFITSLSSSFFERMHSTCNNVLKDEITSQVLVLGGRKAPNKLCHNALLIIFNQNKNQPSIKKIFDSRVDLNSNQLNFVVVFDENVGWEVSESVSNEVFSSEQFRKNLPLLHRYRHTTTAFVDSHTNTIKFFVHGGRSHGGLVLNDTWLIDADGWKFEEVKLTPEQAVERRHSHTSTYWPSRNSMVLYGGLNENAQILDSVQIVNLNGLTMKRLVVLGEKSLPPRFSHSSHLYKDQLIVVGGVMMGSNNHNLLCSIVDLNTGAFRNIRSENTNFSFHNHTSFLSYGNNCHNHEFTLLKAAKYEAGEKDEDICVTVLGGGGNYFSFGTNVRRKLVKFKIHL